MQRLIFPLALAVLVAAGGYWTFARQRHLEPTPGALVPESTPHADAQLLAVDPAPAEAPPSPSSGVLQASPRKSQRADLSARNTEAIAELEAARFAKAVELFEEVHAAEPEEPVFQSNLAEALARWAVASQNEELQAALERLERAIVLAPERSELVTLRDRLNQRWQEQADFVEDQSLHFSVSYDGGRRDLLARGYLEVLQDLEAAYQDFGEFFDVFPVEAGRAKFRAILYDREAFDRVTGIGEWAGGAYDGTIRIPVRNFERDHPAIRHTLRHELVHAFIETIGGRGMDGWLNEGLAQYLSPEGVGSRNAEVFRARQRLQGQTLFALEALQGTLASIQEEAAVAKAYDQSLAFTAYLAEHYGERTLVRMIQDAKEGLAPRASFSKLVGIDLSVVHQDFAESL